MVSVFKNIKVTTDPDFFTVDEVLESIRLCRLEKIILTIRAETDKKKHRELKEQLPCICFSGVFSTRTDKGCSEHSGFAILDIDHVGDMFAVEQKKTEVSKLPFVYAAFISPSGDGVKVLAKIPADIEKHRGHYRALMKLFPQTDSTSINLSRVCYGSADANIYINKEAIEFTEYDSEPVVQSIQAPVQVDIDYSKLNIGAKMIRDAVDGDKHHTLLKASKLMGGLIAGGLVDEGDAVRMLEYEIRLRGVDDFILAQKTISDGIQFGKNQPIVTESDIVVTSDASEYIAAKEETDKYIEQIRNGTFQIGKATGLPTLDDHFRFKDANLVMNLGHDNVGKSVITWYLALLSALLHDWRWIIHAAENKIGGVKRKLLEFYLCKSVKDMTPEELERAMAFVESHFTFLNNNDLWTYKDLLDIGRKINDKQHHNALIIDPYNSLYFPEGKERHEWDLRATSVMRTFIRETQCSIFLNIHAVTEALRRKYPKESQYFGHPMPPEKADAEGGGKFANRCDDFIVTHRLLYHAEWMWTQIHIKKIKEMETGGQPTQMDLPVRIRSVVGGFGFEDEFGYNPITKTTNTNRFNEIVNEFSRSTPHPDAFVESKKDDDQIF